MSVVWEGIVHKVTYWTPSIHFYGSGCSTDSSRCVVWSGATIPSQIPWFVSLHCMTRYSVKPWSVNVPFSCSPCFHFLCSLPRTILTVLSLIWRLNTELKYWKHRSANTTSNNQPPGKADRVFFSNEVLKPASYQSFISSHTCRPQKQSRAHKYLTRQTQKL